MQHFTIWALRLAVLFLPVAILAGKPPEGTDPRDVDVRYAWVVLPDDEELYVEVADTPLKQILGLMGRESLDPKSGMLFRFDESDFHSIWMKNMVIPIDILWLDEDSRIVHVEESAPPCRDGEECPSYRPMRRALYVLELSAGSFRNHKLALGDRLEIRELETEQ